MLEIKNLMVFYENAIAINNISMKCEGGKVTGIFGANSAGKSTLMYTISGIILDVKRKEEMKGGERITVLDAFVALDIGRQTRHGLAVDTPHSTRPSGEALSPALQDQ